MIFLSFRPGPPSSLWRKIEVSQREFKVFLGKKTIFSFPMKESILSSLLLANLFFGVFPNIRIPLLAQCHHPNWSTGDNRVLGRPSLKRRRAVCRKSKRRKSSQNGGENEERTNIKEEGEEGVNWVNCVILRTPSLVEKQVVSKGSNKQKNKEEKVFLRTQEKKKVTIECWENLLMGK